MSTYIETVIVGGGQAGLATSYYLSQQDRPHIVLEQATQAGNAWRNHRWDSFTLNTPNWQSSLPGAEISSTDPDGFLSRDEIVQYFEEYVKRFHLPVQYGVQVQAVRKSEANNTYTVETSVGIFEAQNVVIATGLYQKPKLPAFSGHFPAEIMQMHSDEYRNPHSLPAGAVLVVGSAQSGAQIAEELYQSGRKVYLSVSRSGRVPRRYRGKDINWWSNVLGLYNRTVDQLKSPREKFGGKPHISGTKGGHTLNLHQFARDGVTLLGRVTELKDNSILLAHDLYKNLAAADQFESNLTARIDSFIHRQRLTFPKEVLPNLKDGYNTEEMRE